MITKPQAAFVKYSAIATVITAVIVLAGWQLNIQVFKSILPGFSSMNPFTAVGFIICGLWLLLSIKGSRDKKSLRIVSFAILFIGISKLVEIFIYPALSPDKFLFPSRIGDNQMAITTAFGFIVIGLIFLTYSYKQKLYKAFNFLYAVSVFIALFSLCSYFFNLHEITKQPITPMALNTCLLLALLNFNIAFYFKNSAIVKPFFSKGMGGVTGRRLLPYALFLPIIVSWIRFKVHQNGVYNPELAVSALTAIVTFALVIFVWDRSRFLNKMNEEKDDLLERFMYVNRATSDAIFDWNIEANRVKRYKDSTAGEDETGVRFDLVHPEDLANVQNIIHTSLDDPSKHEYTFACRYKNQQQQYKNILVKAYIIRQGTKAARVVGAVQDLTELRSLEQKLFQQEKNSRLKLMRSIIETQEKERRNVALELHDNVNQILTSCKLMLETAKEQKENTILIERTYSNIRQVIDEIRKISHDLSPSTLEDIGLKEAIEQMIETINLTGKIKIRHHYINELEDSKMKIDDKIAIFRIIQEQVSNVVKYSKANNVKIEVVALSDKVQIAIEDDGIGFDTTNVKKGLGLKNIENRVEYYEGTLDIYSKINTGCKMDVVLNLS